MNNLQIFKNEEFGEVRTVIKDGEPMFCLADVCRVLDISNVSMCKGRLNQDGVSTTEVIDSIGRKQSATFISESNFYKVIFQSRKPEAERFTDWVTSEVLPQIRKTGSYHLPQSYKEALRELLIAVEEKEKLALENENMKPKADFFDAVADSKDATDIANVAKVLNVPGYGRNNLFEFLRKKGILQPNNIPYQRYIDNGWFRVIEQKYQRDGMPCINFKTLVYQRGVDGIRKLLLKV